MVLDDEKLKGKNIYTLKSKLITNNQTLLKTYLNETLDCKYNYNLIVLIICNLS